MNADFKKSPRTFAVGDLEIEDYGKVTLKPWEMISVMQKNSGECDITATDWGFYLGSSLNDRMKKEGFKVALVKNSQGKLFVNAVDKKRVEKFEEYIASQKSSVTWLDECK